MTINIEYYQKINGTYGFNNKKEYYINSAKQQILNEFEDNIAFENVKINNLDREVWIMDRSNSFEKSNDVKIISKPNEVISAGDLVEWKNEIWLITSIIEDGHNIYTKGYMVKCNNELKWIDKNQNLISVPCVISKSLLNKKESQFVTLPENQTYCIVPNTDETINIELGTRFILGSKVYELSSDGDDITCLGLITFKLTQTEKNKKDDFVTKIACNDWITKSELTNTDSDGYSVTINGADFIKLGQSATYTAVFTHNGVPENVRCNWVLKNNDKSGITDLATITSVNTYWLTECVIKANSLNKYGYCQLLAHDDNEEIICSKRILIKSLIL